MIEGSFCWYELVTTDAPAAETFYAKTVGWSMRDSGMPGFRYTLASAGDATVAGLMAFPGEEAVGKPLWLGYVAVADVDIKVGELTQAGGKLYREARDIPGVGRFAVVADPQGAAFVLFRGQGTPPPSAKLGTAGHIGWHELHAADWEAAFAFYGTLFGWRRSTAMDMGEMGQYQLFSIGGVDAGAMFNNPRESPFWLYYVNVDDIDAASERMTGAGGTVLHGPMQVPGDRWIIQARDPQGAMFALLGPRRG